MSNIPLQDIKFPGLGNTYTIPQIDSTLSVAGKAADSKKTGDEIESLKSEITDKSDTADMLKAFPTDTASGAVASFVDGANVPVKSLIVNIDPVQSGSGDPSPDNVRPISGWSEVNVHRMSKNRLPFPYYSASKTTNGITFTVNDDGSVTVKGTATSAANFEFAPAGADNVVENGEYIISIEGGNENCRFVYGLNGSDVPYGTTYTDARITVSVSGRVGYCVLQVSSGATIDTTVYPMIRLASDSDPTYVPYNSVSLTIDLGQTVYGGKLDVTKGELVIDMSMVDLGTLDWTYVSSSLAFVSTIISNFVMSAGWYGICDSYPIIRSQVPDLADKAITNGYGDGRIRAKNSDYTDATAFKTAMSGVQLAYELATPLTIQLDPHEVTALLGSNNVWADSGDSTVEYRADPTLYIGRLTEPDADMIADANIVSGQYFMVGNTLYKATANIASGATISPNVNCARKSLSEALNELNA